MIAADNGSDYFDRLFRVSGRTLVIALLVPVAIFIALNLLQGGLIFFGADRTSALFKVLRFFDFNGEQKAPAFFNSLLLTAAAFVNYHGWRRSVEEKLSFKNAWLALTLIFLYISMDEVFGLHELTTAPLRELFGASGVFYWAWIIPAFAIVFILGILFTPFLRHLPRRTAKLMVLAAVIFLSGALGLEMFEGYALERFGGGVFTDISIIIEETAEMVGSILYLYAVCEYLGFPRDQLT